MFVDAARALVARHLHDVARHASTERISVSIVVDEAGAAVSVAHGDVASARSVLHERGRVAAVVVVMMMEVVMIVMGVGVGVVLVWGDARRGRWGEDSNRGRLGAGNFKLTVSPQVPRSVATSVSVIMYPTAATSQASLPGSVTEHDTLVGAWVGG